MLTWLIIIGLGLAAGAAITINWSKIIVAWKGKRLAVLGAEATGKTRLIHFLTTGKVPERYEPTQATQKTDAAVYNLQDLELTIKASHDVPGQAVAADQWRMVVKEADVLFYLARADLLLRDDLDATNRLRRDTNLIRRWLSESNVQTCFMILSWVDQIPGYQPQKLDWLDNIKKQLTEKDEIRDAADRLRFNQEKKVHVILGSQKEKGDQQQLVMWILKALER